MKRDEHLLHAQACLQKPRPTQDAHLIAPNLLARRFSFDKPDYRMGRRYYLYPHRRGLALLRCCERPFAQSRSSATPSPTASTQSPLAAALHGRPAPQTSARPHLPSDRGVNTPPTLTVSVSPVSASGKACPARAIPMTTPWLKTSSAASSASASICAISPQGGTKPWRTSSLISRLLQPGAPAFLYWLASSGCLCACLV